MSNYLSSSPLINVMVGALKKASKGLIRDFGEIEHLQVSQKGLGDFVSCADVRSEKMIIEELRKARPSFSYLAEESGRINGEDLDSCWIIDPLDGTTNFLHGVPYFSMVIALEVCKEITAAVVYAPIQDEFFYAEKGKGAFLNQKRIRVSARRNLSDALVASSSALHAAHRGTPKYSDKIRRLSEKVAGLRHFGSAALDLAYMATGRYDIVIGENYKPWDMAAGILLVREAGGYVKEIDGGDEMLKSGNILAANADLHFAIKNI